MDTAVYLRNQLRCADHTCINEAGEKKNLPLIDFQGIRFVLEVKQHQSKTYNEKNAR